MIEIKEIGRLYTAKEGLVLVVGKMEHQLDWERTAAQTYYHDGLTINEVFKASSMQKLRIKLENLESEEANGVDELVKVIMSEWRINANSQTKLYSVSPDKKLYKELKPKTIPQFN